jgi:RNA-binding protein YhbY
MVFKEIQLGKQGITDNFIVGLKNQFKNCQTIKISVLRSCCRDKDELKKITQEILGNLGKNYTARTIGYTIALKKWRKRVKT